jgi:hypothetical protein
LFLNNANKLVKNIPIPIPHTSKVTICIALIHSLPVNLAKLKNESATTKKAIAIARRCGFLLLIKFVLAELFNV